MDEKGEITYSFELKELSYHDLCESYRAINNFIIFLKKAKDDAEVVPDDDEKKEEEES